MAVAVIMEFKGATLAQYDQVIEKMNLSKGGPGPPAPWVTGWRQRTMECW